MAATKVGEAYVEVRPRVAKDFGKQIREGIEKQLEPITNDLGRNIGDSLGDSVGENFSARFSDHARGAFDDIAFDTARGTSIGQTLGDQFGQGFNENARQRIKGFGDGIEGDLRISLTRVTDAASRTGREIESNLTERFSVAHTGARKLASGFGSLASSAVLASGQLAATAGALSAAAPGALALGAALAPSVGIFAAMPGAIALGVGAISTLKVAFAGLGDVFSAALTGDIEEFQRAVATLPKEVASVAWEVRSLKPSLDGLRVAVQREFFGHLVGEFGQLRSAIPSVQEGMTDVADVFGDAARQVLRFVADAETVDRVSRIFDATRDSVSRLTQPLDILLVAFRDLAVLGAEFITTRLVPSIADAGNRLGWFLSTAASTGDAWRWME
ncbi:hypothetical protein, partial [Nonomuraea longicatena]|uniref:hypothetical protein n=1 Tax=Nonomuraea longicatena TaxID=83682 RepID=UPI0031D9B488